MDAQEHKKYIGQRIRALRKQKGWNLAELAAHMHLTIQMISLYERGESDPSSTRVTQFANIFGVHPGEFYAVPEEKIHA